MDTKAFVNVWFDRVWNQKDASAIQEMMHPDATGTTEGGVVTGPVEFKTLLFDPLVTAFPDIRLSIDGLMAEGDEATVKWTVQGTHKGPFAHIPASGRRVKFSGMTWLKLRGDKLIEGADRFNLGAVMTYLSEGALCAATVSADETEPVA